MIFWISLGADAVKAIKGALVRALKPPILLNDLLKSLPLWRDSTLEFIATQANS